MSMQKFHSFLFLTILVKPGRSRKGHEKKILVCASGDIQVDDGKQHDHRIRGHHSP